jgi:signal transduction histidine kinase
MTKLFIRGALPTSHWGAADIKPAERTDRRSQEPPTVPGVTPDRPAPRGINLQRLLPYVADLELEVDRLRRHNRLLHQEERAALDHVRDICTFPAESAGPLAPLAEVGRAVTRLAGVLAELQEPPGYHPAHDQVIAVAVRPLAEQVFRWQQRLQRADGVALRLDLTVEHVEWFPARLRHVLDNLLSNALKYRDADKAEQWVRLALRASPDGYEFRVTDNGVGMPRQDRTHVLELFHRSAPARAAGLGVGLAVVKLLVEQSGGTLTVDAGEGQGATFVVVLPRYDHSDYLE